MKCPTCEELNSDNASVCAACGTPLPPPSGSGSLTELPTVAPTLTPSAAPLASGIVPGSRLGNRYEILSILGQGGMGTVYKAHDRELKRTVALKVIRPDLAAHASIVERFKREILLASQVTHRNVLRIHDLGEVGEVKFISMSYVEGSDLHSLLRREGPLPPERALPLVRQIAEALQAAHDAGVVHRDLKPQNILIDVKGSPYIADFGISRWLEAGETMTETGALIGTIDYMSPEQARGETADHRSDIYSLGVILYEILTGTVPFKGGSSLSLMMKRVHQDAPTLRQSHPTLPLWLSAIVARALNRDREARYQSVAELLRDLDRQRASIAWKRLLGRRLLAAAAALLVLAAVAIGAMRIAGSRRQAPVAPRTSLAVLPFQNATGDPGYDWVRMGLAETIRSDLLQASALRLVGGERVQDILDGLKLTDDSLSRPENLQRVAGLCGAENILMGRLMKAGDQFRLEASIVRGGAGTAGIEPIRVEGRGEEALFSMADDLTSRIRDALGVPPGWREASRSAAEITTRSVEALKLYSEGLALSRTGNDLEAARKLEEAVQRDTEFSLAHALLAETYKRLGYLDKARGAAESAGQGLGKTSTYESARIRAVRARLSGEVDSAIEAYKGLCEIAPHSAEAHLDLAAALEEAGDLAGALGTLRKVIELDPKHPNARYALGRVQVKLGNAADGLKELTAALALHLEAGNEKGRADVLNGLGVSYMALSRYDAALGYFEESLRIRERIGDQRGVRVALINMARVKGNEGKYDEATKAARDAVAISQRIGDRTGQAEGYLILGDLHQEAGRAAAALDAYQESLKIVREAGDETNLAQSLSNVGYIYTVMGRYVEAYFFLREALAKRREVGDRKETLRALADIGIVEQVQGRYDEAIKYYLEGLPLARETGDTGAIAALTYNLSNIHEDQGGYGSALALLSEAEPMVREIGDAVQIASCLTFIGSTRRRLGDLSGAEAALKEALTLAREMDNAPILAEALTHQGQVELARGRKVQALAALREAVAAAQRAEDRRLQLLSRMALAEATRSIRDLERVLEEAGSIGLAPLAGPGRLALARLLMESGKHPEAVRDAQKAIQVSAPLKQRDVLFQAHHLAAKLLEGKGRADEAVEHYLAGMALLEEMRDGLNPDALSHLLGRSDVASFGREGAAYFQREGRSREAGRLQALLQP